jgi:glycosyltransferase involved in cell wall biosynthesis
MRIAFLVSSLQFGGAERVASTLCNSWASEGHEVTLIATYSGDARSYFELSPRINLVYLAHPQNCWLGSARHSFARLVKLRVILRAQKPDVVISFLPSANLMAILGSCRLSIPTVICERTDPEFYPQPWIWRFACRHLYRFADVLTVQTENVADKAGRLFCAVSKVQVVPNPLPFQPEQDSTVTLPQSRVLLSVGRLTEGKQVDQLIQVFAHLHHEFPDWQLHIYGDGAEKTRLIEMVKNLCATEFVKILGDTARPLEVMREAEGFAMTSRFEGFPNALLEALAIGLPTVVYDCPSGPAEITQNGQIALLVPPNDLKGLTDSLRRMLSDRMLREDLHIKSKTSIRQRYHLDKVLLIWQKILSDVIRNVQK